MLMFISFFLLLSLGNCVFIDPDYDKNVTELIRSKGYPCENYTVVTEDGYILSIQRIPYGKNENTTGSKDKPVVLLVHGFTLSGDCWFLNFENQSLGFILPDHGYDTWVVSTRGTPPSKKHLTLSNKSKQFWEFSFDEVGKYDIPATIDLILNFTGQNRLSIVSYSLGAADVLAMLVEVPESNNQVNLHIHLAPAVLLSHMTSPLRLLAPFVDLLHFFFNLFGVYELNLSAPFIAIPRKWLCNSPLQFICEQAAFIVQGYDYANTNLSRIGVYLNHIAAESTSVRTGAHILQLVNSGKFQKYDFKRRQNLKVYGQPTPPEYDLSKMTAPTVLMSGPNDKFVTQPDVRILEKQCNPSLNESYVVNNKHFNHLDFDIALEAYSEVYMEVLRLLKMYS